MSSKENKLRPGKKIRYILGLKGLIYIFCKVQLVCINILCLYQMLLLAEMKSFTKELMVSTDYPRPNLGP